jgi:uroporphyrinogen-III decarboxylase
MTTMQQKDDLRHLMEQVETITASPENQHRSEHWKRYWSGVPANEDPDGPLFSLDIGIPTWSRILGFDVRQYYSDTYTQIRCQLLMRIYHHQNMADDTVVGTGVGVNPVGVVLEPSMLGVQIGFPPDMEPWALHNHAVIESEAELASLPMPDFYTSGAMPAVHRMYDEAMELMQELTGGRWQVGFPVAIRGVLGLAQAMRGPHENILLDMLERPDLAHHLFSYVTDFHCNFMTERSRFLGEPMGLGHIGNDEVTTPFVSPRLYSEFPLPYEQRISQFHGGLSCWHSCGTTTALLPAIRSIPNIKQFYTGPWTDLDAVMAHFGDTPLYIAVNTVDDVMAATPEQMEAKIMRVMDTCGGAPLIIRAGAMNSAFDLQADLQQMRLWTQVAQAARQGRAR